MNDHKSIKNCNTYVIIELEKLPVGILLLSNVSRHEWDQGIEAYHASDAPDKRLVLFGIDPSIETKAQYVEFPKGCVCQK